MFDSLADQIRHDEREQTNNRERAIRWVVISVLSVVLFLGLYAAVRVGG
jgi:flagellar basal body-associated protein FliL